MAVYTFSTKEKNKQDTEAVEAVKAYCDKHHTNFSALMVACVHKLREELVDGRQNEV